VECEVGILKKKARRNPRLAQFPLEKV
jgi:hypothetical protein